MAELDRQQVVDLRQLLGQSDFGGGGGGGSYLSGSIFGVYPRLWCSYYCLSASSIAITSISGGLTYSVSTSSRAGYRVQYVSSVQVQFSGK